MEAQMVNEININPGSPIMEVLSRLERGQVSFEQAIGAIKGDKITIIKNELPPAMYSNLKLEMPWLDLCNLTPYI
jgi:hypothetical protein